jgi:ABC-type Zn uptake system ZnuABC Zn-binding protein ZnuA
MTPAAAGLTRRAAVAGVLAAAAGARAAGLVPADVCTTRLRVVATTSDLASLAARVGGDMVEVQAIVPPSADAESFEPRASDLALLANAALVLRIGLGFDHWLDKLLERRERGPGGKPGLVVDASADIPLLEVVGRNPFAQDNHGHGIANPHYWLDPANAVTMTATIGEAIARVSPQAGESAMENRRQFVEQLHRRMAAWAQALAPFRGTALVSYHNSWPYFARRFHLNVVDFIEPREGVTPSVAHLASLLDSARRQNVRAILQATGEPGQFSQNVAARLGLPLVRLAPGVGSVPRARDYLGLMDHNVDTLARALGAAG